MRRAALLGLASGSQSQSLVPRRRRRPLRRTRADHPRSGQCPARASPAAGVCPPTTAAASREVPARGRSPRQARRVDHAAPPPQPQPASPACLRCWPQPPDSTEARERRPTSLGMLDCAKQSKRARGTRPATASRPSAPATQSSARPEVPPARTEALATWPRPAVSREIGPQGNCPMPCGGESREPN